MKIKSSKKRKLLIGLGIVLVSTMLITAGILKLINDSKTDLSVETLEKNKGSNLFNIRQEEESEEEGYTITSPVRNSSNSDDSTPSTSRSSYTSNAEVKSNAEKTSLKATTPQIKTPTVEAPKEVVDNNKTNQEDNNGNNEPQVPVTPSDDPTQNETPNEPDIPEIPVENTGHTITIQNSVAGHKYDAYAIFTGNLYERIVEKDGEQVKEKILSDITWGPEFEKYGDDIITLLKSKNSSLYGVCETAEKVAEQLHKNPAFVDEFTVIIGDFIKSHKEIIPTGSTSRDDYKIPGLASGYYIVIDSQINSTDDSYSRYMIDVVSDVTMEIKATKSTLRKTVSERNVKDSSEDEIDETRNTAIYYGEDNKKYDIVFDLIATMPDDITGYSKYDYTIVDIIDEGFELKYDDKSNLELTMKIGDKIYPKTETIVDEDGVETIKTNYTVTPIVVTEANYADLVKELKLEDKGLDYYKEKTILKIDIIDLLNQIKDKKIGASAEVVFEYNARLNEKHNIGYKENLTQAHLIYSDNPHEENSKSKTTKSTTYTYSIDLEISKIAELKSETDKKELLSDAKFEIYEISDMEHPIATITTGNNEDNKGYATYSSLGIGTYYIREVEAPDGYNKLREDIQIVIDTNLKDDNTIEWSVSQVVSDNVKKLITSGIATKQATEGENTIITPYVELEVQNTSGFQLPTTGGIGTAIFTIVGLSIMILAIICLKSNKKR